MYFNNATDMNQSPNNQNQNHNQNQSNNNRTTSSKNCSTSSTDSGVVLIDNAASYNNVPKAEATTKDKSYNSNSSSKGETKDFATAERHRISIEHTVNVNKASAKSSTSTKSRVSPTLSIRSTTISIVSIDENAVDSSCIDSDSDVEADAEGLHSGYTVQKLGQQISYPPNSADLPQLHKGLTVVSQQIRPNGDATTNGAGVVAEQLLSGGLAPGSAPAAPQIGSIALTNSTDVTFGDKHFYEGPVTIQQFLIDNREKWKPVDGDGQDNPNFNGETGPNGTAAGAKVGEPHNNLSPKLCPFLPHSISRKAVTITVAFVLLTFTIGIILVLSTNLFGKTINKRLNGTLEIVSVADWGGVPAKKDLDKLILPAHHVVISHTASEGCEIQSVCSYRVRVIQEFHMNGWKWDHVGYNFMIGGDGRVYMGRGWDFVGAHTKGYNVDGIGISFIGTFNNIKPTPQQLEACQLLIAEGVRLGKLSSDYKLYGHRQLSATESPGELLYKIIKEWPHWSSEV